MSEAKLVFYTNPMSRGRIAHWMMEEIGQPYETVWLDYATTMHEPEYLAVNPMGKVPALKHGEAVVTETAAICAYLADRFPEQNLIPPVNSPLRAAFFRWMFFAAGPLEQAVTVNAQKWVVGADQEGFLGFGNFTKTINTLEQALLPGPYICGEQFTAADVYVGSHISWGMLFGSIEKRPSFEAYVARLYARPAYQRANEINEARKTQT